MPAGEGYERFENSSWEETSSNGKGPIGRVVLVDDRPAVKFVQPLPEEVAKRRRKHQRVWRFLRTSTAVGLLLACCMVIVEAFVDVVIAQDDDSENFGVCGLGTGVWAGIMGVVAGALGVCTFRTIHRLSRALMIGHFVMSIIAAVSDGVLIIITAFCVDALPYVRLSYGWDHETRQHTLLDRSNTTVRFDQMLYAIAALLLLLAFVHLLICVISSAMICWTYWCKEDAEARMTVVYCQRISNADQGTTSTGTAPLPNLVNSSIVTVPAFTPTTNGQNSVDLVSPEK